MPNPASLATAQLDPSRPVVASYIVTFLKPEMLHVYRQVRALSRWRAHVICQKRENAESFPIDSVEIVPKPRTHQLRRWWQKTVLQQPITIYRGEAHHLRDSVEKSGAVLLHIYFGHIGVHLLPLLEILRIPAVVSFHGADAQVNLGRPKHRAATLRMMQLAKLLLVRSEELAARLVDLGADPKKIRLHRTGLPLDDLPFSQRTPPSDGAWHLVQASRLIEKKGLATTVRAFASFARQFPQARLTLAGDGPLRESITGLATELAVADRVHFAGFLSQPQLRALYESAHLFVHPSEVGPDGNQEGVPNSMLEAMATGLPVLATLHGGIPEAVENGVSGMLVAERDHDALARGMLDLVQSHDRYAAMGAAASVRVRERFDLRSTVPALETIYEEAAGLQPS
jgi:colanic acid/amylovoran biosynthesis glycosyltransferase